MIIIIFPLYLNKIIIFLLFIFSHFQLLIFNISQKYNLHLRDQINIFYLLINLLYLYIIYSFDYISINFLVVLLFQCFYLINIIFDN